jgi:hypothetical protein
VKVILLLICLAICVPVCLSQSNETVKPDLSGTWEFEAPRNKQAKSQDSTWEQVKITHRDPELIIRLKIQTWDVTDERDLIYYTDGRGETNTARPMIANFDSWQPGTTDSQTIWSKDKVVTRSVEQSFSGAAIVVYEIVDEWKLSSDGKTLTQTTKKSPKKDVKGNAAFGNEFESRTVYKLISK